MAGDRDVQFYLEDLLRQSAARGEHPFLALVAEVLVEAGLRPVYAAAGSASAGGYSLTHMAQPPDDRGLLFRRVYHYPFWQIEAVAERWHWDTARAAFDGQGVAPDAGRFYRYWQNRLFGAAPADSRRAGFIYVPLQGHLDRCRSFQACSPLEMIEHCLEHGGGREVIVTLHPGERYTDQEVASLDRLVARHRKLSLGAGEMAHYLQGCDYVVTQNSSVAFAGYFFGKPALLFGRIDFHHIAVTADLQVLEETFDRVARLTPPYASYVHWFWQERSINAGRPDAKERIAARLRRFKWPIP